VEPLGTFYHCTSRANAEKIIASKAFWGNAALTPNAAAVWHWLGEGDPVVLELAISWEYGQTWGRDNRRFNEATPVEVVRVLTIEEARAATTIEP
jgi:hypothetical protein